MLQAFLQGAFELIFPDNCLLCRQFLNSHHQKQLCPKCQSSLKFNPTPFSRESRASWAFEQSWSVCLYNETAQKLLHAYKYNGKTSLTKTFVPMMIDFIDRHQLPVPLFDTIVPIPLHPVKFRERGYNQSALLSRALGKHYGVKHQENILLRQKHTQTQTELGAKQRWTNLEGAFRIQNSNAIQDQSILLVDDLFTTGATVEHAAQALKEAGAARVCVLTFSITMEK